MLSKVPSYLETLKHEGMSPATVWNYGTRLKHFQRWLEEQGRDFTRRATQDYIRHLQLTDGYRPRTIRVALTAIKSFTRYLASLEFEVPPLDNIRTPRLDAPQRISPTDGDVLALFDGAKRLPGHTDVKRYHKRLVLAVLSVFADCGLRAAELMALDVEDYDAEGRRLRVRRGKGGQTRWVPVNDRCRGHLADWLEIRQKLLEKKGREEPALFLNSKYRRLGELGLRSLWDELLEVSGLAGSGIVRHSLRHWFASGVAREDLVTAKELLGHSSVQTTASYLHAQESRMRRAVDRLATELVVSKVEQPKEKPTYRPRRLPRNR